MYEGGKIYKITCGELTYYGSTCNALFKRFHQHKNSFKSWQNDKIRYITSFKLFEIGEPIITLVEKFSCETKEELLARERWYIENNVCVNKTIPTRTNKEYRTDNAEKIKEKNQEYYVENIEEITEYKAQWYQENKERLEEQNKEYRDAHKEEKAKYDKEYRDINEEKLHIRRKEYYAQNSDIAKQKAKEWRLANPEKDSENSKQWAKDNPERRREIANNYAMKDWKCECCEQTIKISGRARHIKTAKHILKSQPIVNVS